MFKRAYRVQMNTLESAAVFLPAMWLYAAFMGDKGAAVGGEVWIVARVWYAIAYQSDPAKRSADFGISVAAFVGLCRPLAGCLVGSWQGPDALNRQRNPGNCIAMTVAQQPPHPATVERFYP
jgi:glutathione S-transferase